jgi:hypothetical protein
MGNDADRIKADEDSKNKKEDAKRILTTMGWRQSWDGWQDHLDIVVGGWQDHMIKNTLRPCQSFKSSGTTEFEGLY